MQVRLWAGSPSYLVDRHHAPGLSGALDLGAGAHDVGQITRVVDVPFTLCVAAWRGEVAVLALCSVCMARNEEHEEERGAGGPHSSCSVYIRGVSMLLWAVPPASASRPQGQRSLWQVRTRCIARAPRTGCVGATRRAPDLGARALLGAVRGSVGAYYMSKLLDDVARASAVATVAVEGRWR